MTAMCGGSAGGDGGDDGRRRLHKDRRESWDCHMIDKTGVVFKKSLKTQKWSTVGQDGSKVVLRLDDKGEPEGHEGCFLCRVNEMLVKSRLFDIGPTSWRKVAKVEKDHAFDNHIRQKFHWDDRDEKTIKKYVLKDLGKKWKEDREELWDKLCDPTKPKDYNYAQKPQKVDLAKWETFVDSQMNKKHNGRVRRPTPLQVFDSSSSSQRSTCTSQSYLYTDPAFRLFTDGVLSLLNKIVSSTQVPSDVVADVHRLTQTFGGGVPSSQHLHGDPHSGEAGSARGDQQSDESRRPETAAPSVVGVTSISSDVAGSDNRSGGSSHSSSSNTGSVVQKESNVLSSTTSDSDSESDDD